jgi:hypothetical protein
MKIMIHNTVPINEINDNERPFEARVLALLLLLVNIQHHGRRRLPFFSSFFFRSLTRRYDGEKFRGLLGHVIHVKD